MKTLKFDRNQNVSYAFDSALNLVFYYLHFVLDNTNNTLIYNDTLVLFILN